MVSGRKGAAEIDKEPPYLVKQCKTGDAIQVAVHTTAAIDWAQVLFGFDLFPDIYPGVLLKEILANL